MKSTAAILGFVLFVMITTKFDAKSVRKLPNGGQILSSNGTYIPGEFGIHEWNSQFKLLFLEFKGIIPRIFGPLFVNLKNRSSKCSIGYVEIMLNIMNDTDAALTTNNAINLRLLFKVFASLSQMQLQFIRDKPLHEALVLCVQGNREEEARLSNGCIDWVAVNKFFVKASNALNDCLNWSNIFFHRKDFKNKSQISKKIEFFILFAWSNIDFRIQCSFLNVVPSCDISATIRSVEKNKSTY